VLARDQARALSAETRFHAAALCFPAATPAARAAAAALRAVWRYGLTDSLRELLLGLCVRLRGMLSFLSLFRTVAMQHGSAPAVRVRRAPGTCQRETGFPLPRE
jgi:hypothetical protein